MGSARLPSENIAGGKRAVKHCDLVKAPGPVALRYMHLCPSTLRDAITLLDSEAAAT